MPLVVVRPSCKQWWEAQHAGSGLHRLCGAVELHFPSQTPGALLVQTLSVATRLGWQGPVQITQVQSTVRQDSDKIGVEGAAKLSSVLTRSIHLRHLALGGHSIRDEGAEALVAALHKTVTLESLNLRDNYLSDRAARALARALPEWPRLTLLDMVSRAPALSSPSPPFLAPPTLPLSLPTTRQQ